jgi:hypothetical protein
VRGVTTHIGNIAHLLSANNVLYIPELCLQILDGGIIPAEGIVDSWNLGHLQREFDRGDHPATEVDDFSSDFPTQYVAEDACILSNMFSINLSHFTEELLKVIILERAGYSGPYVYTQLPAFALEFWDALGLDRRRLMQVTLEPCIFRSALYTTNLNFLDLSKCPDVFLELRDRMFRLSAGIESSFGERLWLDRGINVDRQRDLVNSEEVDSWLDGYGFTRLDMGSLPLLEQIAASRDANVIAGPHGSAFLSCMYMKPQSTVIEIFSPDYLNGYSFEICRVLHHRYVMIVGDNAPHAPHFLPYPYGKAVHVPHNQLQLALQSLSPPGDRHTKNEGLLYGAWSPKRWRVRLDRRRLPSGRPVRRCRENGGDL